MQLPTLSVDAVQDKFVVVCVVPEGVKDVGAVGAAVSAVPVLILPYNLPLARKGMLRKQSIPLYFMETRILVTWLAIVKNLGHDVEAVAGTPFCNQSKLHSPRYKWRLTK
jgi:hypothetical protein